jgi:hypothetical protein
MAAIALAKEGQLTDAQSEFGQVVARSPTNALARHYLDLVRHETAPPERQ